MSRVVNVQCRIGSNLIPRLCVFRFLPRDFFFKHLSYGVNDLIRFARPLLNISRLISLRLLHMLSCSHSCFLSEVNIIFCFLVVEPIGKLESRSAEYRKQENDPHDGLS